jgi:hypothetical protein
MDLAWRRPGKDIATEAAMDTNKAVDKGRRIFPSRRGWTSIRCVRPVNPSRGSAHRSNSASPEPRRFNPITALPQPDGARAKPFYADCSIGICHYHPREMTSMKYYFKMSSKTTPDIVIESVDINLV